MAQCGRPDPIGKLFTRDVFYAAIFGGFMFAMFLYLAFVALLELSLALIGIPEFLSVLASILAAFAYLSYRIVDKRQKVQWFRAVLPFSIVLMSCVIVIVFNRDIVVTIIALILIGLFVFPGDVTSTIAISLPGFFASPAQRGKVGAVIVFTIFLLLIGATISSLSFPELGFRAGLLFMGLVSIVLGLVALYVPYSSRYQFIAAPQESAKTPGPLARSLKRDRMQYFVVLFLFKICLGMLLRVLIQVPSDLTSMDGTWLIIALVATGSTPLIGFGADRVGRKVTFTLACGVMAVMFGVFTFSGQGTGNQWSAGIVLVCLILFGIAYPTILVSEFALFPELCDDTTRLRVVAFCLFIHVTGFGLGLVIGMLFATPNMTYFFLGTNLLTVGLLITAMARESLPDKEELLWPAALRHLYIYHSMSGTGIYDVSFEESTSPHFALVTGGLAGISNLIGEVTRRDGKLTAIQQQDANILFFSGQHVTAALVAEKNLNILHGKLKDLVCEVEDLFHVFLQDFNGDVESFAPLETLVRRFFRPKPP